MPQRREPATVRLAHLSREAIELFNVAKKVTEELKSTIRNFHLLAETPSVLLQELRHIIDQNPVFEPDRARDEAAFLKYNAPAIEANRRRQRQRRNSQEATQYSHVKDILNAGETHISPTRENYELWQAGVLQKEAAAIAAADETILARAKKEQDDQSNPGFGTYEGNPFEIEEDPETSEKGLDLKSLTVTDLFTDAGKAKKTELEKEPEPFRGLLSEEAALGIASEPKPEPKEE